MNTNLSQQQQQHHQKPWWKRSRVKWLAGGVVLAVMMVFFMWWMFFRSYVSTNDARIAANIIKIAPAGVSGIVEKVFVEEGDAVKTGQILVEIDHRMAEANYEKAKARYKLVSSELDRAKSLARKNFSTKRDLDNAKMNYDIADAELRLASISLQNTYLKSPIDGIIIQKLAYPGNLLEQGQVAVAISDVEHAWVSANIEETKIAMVKSGQPVRIKIDEGGTLNGKVQEINVATASQFSLLPSENASGNFTKVVQKIPVKITIDPQKNGRILRAGQSVTVRIKVR